MTWVKLDDQLHAHPKIERAWRLNRAALGLHLMALSHCGAFLTDGFVSEEFVRSKLPSVSTRRRAVEALAEAGLWERQGAGWVIHDWLDCNPSREQMLKIKAQREASRARARTRAHASDPTRPASLDDAFLKDDRVRSGPVDERQNGESDGRVG